MELKKYIHVSHFQIEENDKAGISKPVIVVWDGEKEYFGNVVEILGHSKVSYAGPGETLLPTGERVVIETTAPVIIDGSPIQPLYISIQSDDWKDAGVVYKLLNYRKPQADSSACFVSIETNNHVEQRVIPYHWIELVDNK